MTEPYHSTRVAIIGAGNVGATCAYTLLLRRLAAEIVLVDVNEDKAKGEAMDLNHAVPFAAPTHIWAGDYADCAGAAITIITAGAAQIKPGQTRLDLIQTNAKIFREIVPEVIRYNPDGILLIASNPVDAMTYTAWKLSGLPSNRVIGSGTILDTARFRYLLSQFYGVDSRSVHAFIIGEHGDSEVPVWSLANIAGMRLPDFCAVRGLAYDQTAMDNIYTQTRDAAYSVVKLKGATYYAIGAGLADIVEAILRDQSTVLTVSSVVHDFCGINGICMSFPTTLDQRGVEWVLPMTLNSNETEAVCHSAQVLKAAIAQLGLASSL
jgi:L-lactate dehydrogenase